MSKLFKHAKHNFHRATSFLLVLSLMLSNVSIASIADTIEMTSTDTYQYIEETNKNVSDSKTSEDSTSDDVNDEVNDKSGSSITEGTSASETVDDTSTGKTLIEIETSEESGEETIIIESETDSSEENSESVSEDDIKDDDETELSS